RPKDRGFSQRFRSPASHLDVESGSILAETPEPILDDRNASVGSRPQVGEDPRAVGGGDQIPYLELTDDLFRSVAEEIRESRVDVQKSFVLYEVDSGQAFLHQQPVVELVRVNVDERTTVRHRTLLWCGARVMASTTTRCRCETYRGAATF